MVYKYEGIMVLNKGSRRINLCINTIDVFSQLIVLATIRIKGIDGNTKSKINGSVFSNIFIASFSPNI